MIIINGYKFAETESEITDSLFQSGGTISGIAKRTKRKIMFYDMQNQPIAFVNQYGVVGSARFLNQRELSLIKGDSKEKIWYSYDTPFFAVGLPIQKIWEIPESLSISNEYKKGFAFK